MKENILDYYDEYVIFVILYFCFSSALIIFTMVDFFIFLFVWRKLHSIHIFFNGSELNQHL